MPGFVLGCHLVLLVAFLNPKLELFGDVSARLASLFLPLASVLSLLVCRAGRQRSSSLAALPWLIAAELLGAAVLYGTHAALLGYGLHPGVARRLVKASVSLGVLGLAAFYTALLHSLARRRYGRRSVALFALLLFASIWVAVERRESLHLRAVPLPSANAVTREERAVVVVWLEGASLETLLPPAERGDLPFFARAFREGAFSAVEVLRPKEAIVQTTMALTGKLPFRSGMVSSTVWGLPNSQEQLDLLPGPGRLPWLLALGFRASPRPPVGLTFWEIWRLLDPERTLTLGFTDRLEPESDFEQRWSTGREESVDLIAVRLGHAEHAAQALVPGQQEVEAHTPAVTLARLRVFDQLLSRRWSQRRQSENWVIFSSASAPDGGMIEPSSSALAPGVLVLLGPAAEAGRIARSVRPTDIAPTILHLSGYPSARDFDGRVRSDLLDPHWRRQQPIAFVPSYDFLARRTS